MLVSWECVKNTSAKKQTRVSRDELRENEFYFCKWVIPYEPEVISSNNAKKKGLE